MTSSDAFCLRLSRFRCSLRTTVRIVCFFAVLALTSCAPANQGQERDNTDVAQPYLEYCSTKDCSQFPVGFVSVEFAGEWNYFPSLDWLKAHGVPGVGTKIQISALGHPAHSAEWDKFWTDGKFVVADVQNLFFAPCCEAWENYFGVNREGAAKVAQVRIYSTLKSRTPHLTRDKDPLPVEELPPEIKPWADQYDFVRVSENPSPISERRKWSFSARSKQPMFMGVSVEFDCSSGLCMLSWILESGDYAVKFYIVNLVLEDCEGGCDSSEQVAYTFTQIGNFVSNFETIWKNSKRRPVE